MRGRMVTWAVAAVLALAGTAGAVATQKDLDRAGLNDQADQNTALKRYLKHNGYPEMAEVRPIPDQPPWDDHEVTLYYLKAHKEISFARARVLGHPDVHSTRYERVMTDADVRALEAHGTRLNGDKAPVAMETTCKGSAAARAKCAADRADSAADRVDLAASRAEQAADKTEAIVGKMVAGEPHKTTYRAKH